MTPSTAGDDGLSGAFAARPGRRATADCPPAERLWDAVQGRLAAHDLEAVVEHLVTCSDCAEDWRLAIDLQREVAAEAPRPARMPAARPWLPLALAASLLIALGLVFHPGVPPSPPTYREPAGAAVHSLIPEDRVLPREHFLLRWSADVAGARYNLLVSREDLQEVARARGLTASRYVVSGAALAKLPPGTRLLWQVEVLLPGGERRLSPTFFVRLE